MNGNETHIVIKWDHAFESNFNSNCNWSDYFCLLVCSNLNEKTKTKLETAYYGNIGLRIGNTPEMPHTKRTATIKYGIIVNVEWFRAWKTELIAFVCDHNFYLEIKMVLTLSFTYIRIVSICRTMAHCLYKHTRMLLFFVDIFSIGSSPFTSITLTKLWNHFSCQFPSIWVAGFTNIIFFYIFTAVVAVCCLLYTSRSFLVFLYVDFPFH